jgi:hypothetical protein
LGPGAGQLRLHQLHFMPLRVLSVGSVRRSRGDDDGGDDDYTKLCVTLCRVTGHYPSCSLMRQFMNYLAFATFRQVADSSSLLPCLAGVSTSPHVVIFTGPESRFRQSRAQSRISSRIRTGRCCVPPTRLLFPNTNCAICLHSINVITQRLNLQDLPSLCDLVSIPSTTCTSPYRPYTLEVPHTTT